MKILLIISCLFFSISLGSIIIGEEKAKKTFDIPTIMNSGIWFVYKTITHVMFYGVIITTVFKLFNIHWLWCILISAFTVFIFALLQGIIAMGYADVFGIKTKSFNSFTGKYERENIHFVDSIITFIIGLTLFIIGLIV